LVNANKAAELGQSRFKWWKDWRGECVAIIASGPSTKGAKLDLLRDRIHVIAIKENVNLCPWADVVYGCDEAWWIHRRGLPEYKGVKISYAARACSTFRDIHKIEIRDPRCDRLLVDEPGAIGSGANSGFQALNLAVQFGVNGVILVGYDMHRRNGEHWYGRNMGYGMNNPSEDNFQRWVRGFDAIAGELKGRGIDVVNTSPSSALKCFRFSGIEQTLDAWGL